MGRFLVGVLVAVLAIWGYDRVFGDGPSTQAQGSGNPFVDGKSSGVADPTRPSEGAKANLLTDSGEGKEVPSTPAADDGSLGAHGSLAELAGMAGAERDRMLASLRRRLSSSSTLDERLAVLGPDNGFLRSPEGRAAAVEVADWIAGREPWDAVRGSTRLLELVTSGRIGKEDVEAVATFETLKGRHDTLVRRTVFDPADLTGAQRYVVGSGESLTAIARKQSKALGVKLQTGTLQLVNRISNPNVIREGQVIKIPVQPVHAVLFKSAFVLGVYVGDVMVRAYRCAHGKEGHETPEATFAIGETVERPDWHYNGESIAYGDPRNPLGSHFVKFLHESYSGFGAHGTNEPDTIGTQASLGCIRMGAEDIIEFASFMPRGTEVVVHR
ncbi:MAG: L,D-transpeptidase family protein [Planctomycetota bacterium]